jgi:hypothetical protein
MFSQHIENSSLISLINISQEYRIALQVARKIALCKYEQNYASVSVPPPPAPHKLGIAGNLKPDLHYKNKTRFDKG